MIIIILCGILIQIVNSSGNDGMKGSQKISFPSVIDHVVFIHKRIIVAIKNFIIVSDSFTYQILNTITTGPVNDSLYCINSMECDPNCPSSCGKVSTDVSVKSWIVDRNQQYLIVCYNIYQGYCERFFIDTDGNIKTNRSIDKTTTPVVNADPRGASTLFVFDNILIVCSQRNISYDPLKLNLPVISFRNIDDFHIIQPKPFQLLRENLSGLQLKTTSEFSIKFHKVFEFTTRTSEAFILILFSQPRKLKDSHSSDNCIVMSRMCKEDYDFESYVEIQLQCFDQKINFEITLSDIISHSSSEGQFESKILIIGLQMTEKIKNTNQQKAYLYHFLMDKMMNRFNEVMEKCIVKGIGFQQPPHFSGNDEPIRCESENFARNPKCSTFNLYSRNRLIMDYNDPLPFLGEIIDLPFKNQMKLLSVLNIDGQIVTFSGDIIGLIYTHVKKENYLMLIQQRKIFSTPIEKIEIDNKNNLMIVASVYQIKVISVFDCRDYSNSEVCHGNIFCYWNIIQCRCVYFTQTMITNNFICEIEHKYIRSNSFGMVHLLSSFEEIVRYNPGIRINLIQNISKNLIVWTVKFGEASKTGILFPLLKPCNQCILRKSILNERFPINSTGNFKIPIILKIVPFRIAYNSCPKLTVTIDNFSNEFRNFYQNITFIITQSYKCKFIDASWNFPFTFQCQLPKISIKYSTPNHGIFIIINPLLSIQAIYSPILLLEPVVNKIKTRVGPLIDNREIMLRGNYLNVGNHQSVILVGTIASIKCIIKKISEKSIKCKIKSISRIWNNSKSKSNDRLCVQLVIDQSKWLFTNVCFAVSIIPRVYYMETDSILNINETMIIFHGENLISSFIYFCKLKCPEMDIIIMPCIVISKSKSLKCEASEVSLNKFLVPCRARIFIDTGKPISIEFPIQLFKVTEIFPMDQSIRKIIIETPKSTNNSIKQGKLYTKSISFQLILKSTVKVLKASFIRQIEKEINLICGKLICYNVKIINNVLNCWFSLSSIEHGYSCNIELQSSKLSFKTKNRLIFIKNIENSGKISIDSSTVLILVILVISLAIIIGIIILTRYYQKHHRYQVINHPINASRYCDIAFFHHQNLETGIEENQNFQEISLKTNFKKFNSHKTFIEDLIINHITFNLSSTKYFFDMIERNEIYFLNKSVLEITLNKLLMNITTMKRIINFISTEPFQLTDIYKKEFLSLLSYLISVNSNVHFQLILSTLDLINNLLYQNYFLKNWIAFQIFNELKPELKTHKCIMEFYFSMSKKISEETGSCYQNHLKKSATTTGDVQDHIQYISLDTQQLPKTLDNGETISQKVTVKIEEEYITSKIIKLFTKVFQTENVPEYLIYLYNTKSSTDNQTIFNELLTDIWQYIFENPTLFLGISGHVSYEIERQFKYISSLINLSKEFPENSVQDKILNHLYLKNMCQNIFSQYIISFTINKAQVSNLVSFVKSLLENDNTVIKEENKRKLEAQYNENGATLNKNLADKYEQVSKILAVYKYVSERVKDNRSGVMVIKNNLTQCKKLLQCNRDDLRRLWLELIEKRNCVMLLDALEEVRLAPELVTLLTEARRWTDATVTVITAQKKLDAELQNVVGILPVRTDLSYRQKNLIDRLKSELHKLTFTDVLNFSLKNLNSFGDRRTSDRNFGKKINFKEENESEPDVIKLNPPFSNLSLSNWRSVNIDNEFWNGKLDNFDIRSVSKVLVLEDKSKSEESQQAHNITSVIYSLNQFNKFQELLNEWSASSTSLNNQSLEESVSMNEDHLRFIHKEIHKLIIIKSIEHVKRSAMSQNDSRLDNFDDCRYLLELLNLLYITLFQCQSALLLIHRIVSNLIKARKNNIILSKFEELQLSFDELSIRTIIQTELKSLLSVHLKLSDKDRLLNRAVNKYGNEFNIPNSEVLKHYMGKKKGLLSTVSAIQSNIPVGGHSGGGIYYTSDHLTNNSKQPLFKFSHSSHALSVSACLQEMRPLNPSADDTDSTINANVSREVLYPLVCKPHHNNITSIYGSIMEFIETLEAEEHLNQKITVQKNPCILREYIDNFIEKVFLVQSKIEMDNRLNSTFSEHDAIKGLQNLVSQASERELGLQRPIIGVMLIADQCLEEIKQVAVAINHYSIKCLRNGYEVMNEFSKNLWKWFKDLSNLDTNKDTHMSTEWGKDEDLIRFWKSFPSWQKMMNIDSRENFHAVDHADINIVLNTSLSVNDGFNSGTEFSSKQFKIVSGVISNETTNDSLLEEREARLRINQESDHLLQMIKEEIKSQNAAMKTKLEFTTFAVFHKNDLMKQMARLHESVAWFTQRTHRFQSWLNGKSWLKSNNQTEIILSDLQQQELNKVIKDFSNLHNELNNLADACLMSIHLEGRLRAYNFITRLPSEALYDANLDEVDIDPQVADLVKSLNDLEFALTHALTRHKFRFVFEGLGNFVSALLVQILPKIKIMSTSGIKKMCRNIYHIQQNLSVLTQTHEMDLVRVKQLYELLHVSPEVVVNRIMEQGAVYDEGVYKSVLHIYQQSHTLYDHEKLKAAIMRLSEVINMEYV